MKPTRRGKAVGGVAILGAALAVVFGPRSLGAVVVGAVVSLVAGWHQVRTLSKPSVTRDVPGDGFPGEGGTVRLDFRVDEPFAAVVNDGVPDGLDGNGYLEATVGGDPLSYEVTYLTRGEHTFGPVSVRARDVLGLFERGFTPVARETVLVYPRVHELTVGARRDLLSAHEPGRHPARDEFDRLRAYDRGDALRDIHWKSSAKRDDLVVKVFAAEDESNAVTVAAGAADGRGDAMAEAAASVCLPFLDAGIPVRLSTPGGDITVSGGDRQQLLEHLARAPDGDLVADGADILVEAGETTRVVIRGTDREFEDLTDAPVETPTVAPGPATATSRPTAAQAQKLAWDSGVEG
jgi:uncharacterized protein (DUF58 family)